jgi:hypothetical protein
MKFDAGKAVEALEWDFSTVPVSDEQAKAILKDAKGIVPEPTQDALERFQEHLRSTVVDNNLEDMVSLGDDAPPEQVIAAMSSLPEGALQKVMQGTNDAIKELCAGSPSAEQIDALPARVRLAFVGWLTQSLVGPTRPTSASEPSLATANGAGPAA